MKASNVMNLKKYCSHFNEDCFAGDSDSLATLTCQHCSNGNEVVEKLLEVNTGLLEACKNALTSTQIMLLPKLDNVASDEDILKIIKTSLEQAIEATQ